MASEGNVRVSDADRENTAGQLRENYTQGRLTLDELHQRLDQAFAAKTRSDLDAVTRDLPYTAPTGNMPSDAARSAWGGGGGQPWGAGPGGTGQAGPGWGSGPRPQPSGHCGGGFFRVIPLLVMVAIVLIVVNTFGFGFGSGPSLWVIALAILAALRWVFRRGPFSRRGRRPW